MSWKSFFVVVAVLRKRFGNFWPKALRSLLVLEQNYALPGIAGSAKIAMKKQMQLLLTVDRMEELILMGCQCPA